MADAFHQIAITGNDVCVVINQFVVKTVIQYPLGKGHADSTGEALT